MLSRLIPFLLDNGFSDQSSNVIVLNFKELLKSIGDSFPFIIKWFLSNNLENETIHTFRDWFKTPMNCKPRNISIKEFMELISFFVQLSHVIIPLDITSSHGLFVDLSYHCNKEVYQNDEHKDFGEDVENVDYVNH